MARPQPVASTPGPQHKWGVSPVKTAPASAPYASPSPSRVPGSVPEPRPSPLSAPSPSPTGGERGGSGPSSAGLRHQRGNENVHAEVALYRLGQRLMGKPGAPGPGMDVLRLFANRHDELRLQELLDAVSVLPLGISRAEVQKVFAYIRMISPSAGSSSHTMPIEQLAAAAVTAHNAGVPAEAATLDGIDVRRLAPALQRLCSSGRYGGRSSQQEFRVALMQAERYLSHGQLEWLIMLTDKDGEGRLLPWTLLARLGSAPSFPVRQGIAQLLVPPRPATFSRVPIAKNTPRSLVNASIIARIRERLSTAGPTLTLDRILGLYELGSPGDKDAAVSRDVIVSLLGHTRLGVSATEVDELVSSLVTAGRPGQGGEGQREVQLTRLYDMIQRGGEPEMEALVGELRDAAKQALLGRGASLAASALASDGGSWLPEEVFRRCLAAALEGEVAGEDEEDRLLLLAEKNAAGDIRWRPFAQTYAGFLDTETRSNCSDQNRGPPSPTKKGGSALRIERNDPSSTQQSWRSGKMAHPVGRSVVTPITIKDPEPVKPSPARETRGFCPCRRRSNA